MASDLTTAGLFIERIAAYRLRSEMSDDEILNTDSASELDAVITEARTILNQLNDARQQEW